MASFTTHLICAARPNFMKVAPLYHALKNESWCNVEIVHTGQHYDYHMSQAFFDEFKLPAANHYLGVGSGTHAEQTAQTMISYEKLCLEKSKPDLVVVVGDVNATLACSLAAKKLHLPVAHLEAGLRSFDRTMPEEINRVVTDSISDYLWTPSEDANENLLKEGIAKEKIELVGNIMIDTYCMMQPQIDIAEAYKKYGYHPKAYGILTLHRPSNVDDPQTLKKIMSQLRQIDIPFIFPVHPRTRKKLEHIFALPTNIQAIDPLPYVEFMSLMSYSAYIITDSGGVQEESTYLQLPCFTLRNATERPITVTMGSNQLVTIDDLLEKIKKPKKGTVPPLWDGKTSERVKKIIQRAAE